MSKQLTLSATFAVVLMATLALATALGGVAHPSQDRVAVEAPLVGINAAG